MRTTTTTITKYNCQDENEKNKQIITTLLGMYNSLGKLYKDYNPEQLDIRLLEKSKYGADMKGREE